MCADPFFAPDSFRLLGTQIVTALILPILLRDSQSMCTPFLLLTYAEGGITCVLNVMFTCRRYLKFDTSQRGMVSSSGHTVFTCQLLYVWADFQLGVLPSKQEATRSCPCSFEYPFPLKPTISLPQLTGHSWASPTCQLEEEKGGEEEGERD